MAKRVNLTSKNVDLYETLRKEVMRQRRLLLRKKRLVEQKEGGNPNLPSLIIPEKPPTTRRLRFIKNPWEKYTKYMESMKSSLRAVGSLRRNFLSAMRDILINFGGSIDKNYRADINTGDFVLNKFAELYNRYRNMKALKFNDMYDRGFIVALRWLYAELEGKNTGLSFMDEAQDMLDKYNDTLRKSGTPHTNHSQHAQIKHKQSYIKGKYSK